ncbi:MAG: hypothetical protein ACLPVY_10265 [Acidimicrobiia bacterium]
MITRTRARRLIYVVGFLIAAAIALIPISRSYGVSGAGVHFGGNSYSCGPPVTAFMDGSGTITGIECRGAARTRVAVGGLVALGTVVIAIGVGSLIPEHRRDAHTGTDQRDQRTLGEPPDPSDRDGQTGL